MLDERLSTALAIGSIGFSLFRLHRTPETFQWLIDIVLHLLHQFADLNNVVIHTIHVASHLHHIREVLDKLGRAGLTTNPLKCHLGLTEAQYLVLRID